MLSGLNGHSENLPGARDVTDAVVPTTTGEVPVETRHESPRFVFWTSSLLYWPAAGRCQRLAVAYVSSRVSRTDLHRFAASDPARPSGRSYSICCGSVVRFRLFAQDVESIQHFCAWRCCCGGVTTVVSIWRHLSLYTVMMLWAWHHWSARQWQMRRVPASRGSILNSSSFLRSMSSKRRVLVLPLRKVPKHTGLQVALPRPAPDVVVALHQLPHKLQTTSLGHHRCLTTY